MQHHRNCRNRLGSEILLSGIVKRQIFVQMKLFNVTDINSWKLPQNNKKYLEICWRNPGILSVENSGPQDISVAAIVLASQCE